MLVAVVGANLAGQAPGSPTFSQPLPTAPALWQYPYNSCSLGIYGGSTSHQWSLHLAQPLSGAVTVGITTDQGALGNPGEMDATLGDADGNALRPVYVAVYPNVNGGTASVSIRVDGLAAGTYTLTLQKTAFGHHYTLAASDQGIELGFSGAQAMRYLESGTNNFAVNAGAGESVSLQMVADDPGLYPAPGTFTYAVFNADMTPVAGLSGTTDINAGPVTIALPAPASASTYVVRLTSIGHFYASSNGADPGIYLLPCGPAAGPGGGSNTQVWSADYRLEYDDARTSGDAMPDVSRTDWHDVWRFFIFTDPNGTLANPTITVTPAISLGQASTAASAGTTLNANTPPYIWSGPTLTQSNPMFTSLRTNVAPAAYTQGYSVTRNLVGGRTVAGGATENRTFTATVTPTDPALTDIATSIDFAGFQAGPVSVSNVACSSPDGQVSVDNAVPSQPRAFWQVGVLGGNTIPALPANTPYTLTCSLTLQNTLQGQALYTPSIGVTGTRSASPTQTEANSLSITTNAAGDPPDYLGSVSFNVSPSTADALAQLSTHFSRTVHFDSVNQAAVAASTTNLQSSNPTQNYGQQVTFMASVSGNGGPAPTGSVTFTDGQTVLGSASLSPNGLATLSTSNLTPGSHTVTASYGGDASYLASSAQITQNINKAFPSMALNGSPSPSNAGQNVTFTVTLGAQPGQQALGTPGGTVTFTIDNVQVAVQNVVSGVAAYSTSSLSGVTCPPFPAFCAGHTVQATYNGDNNFIPSSRTTSQVVNKATPTMTLNTSGSPSAAGQNVTFTATLSGQAGTPTGTVTFTVDGNVVSAPGLVNGVATFSTSSLSAIVCPPQPASCFGHSIQAAYGGDVTYSSQTRSVTQFVNKTTPSMTLTSSLPSTSYGQLVTFTVTLADPNHNLTPGGTVTFSIDGIQQLPAQNVVNGQATFSTSGLSSGNPFNHNILAVYSGDPSFNSQQRSVTQVVNRIVPTITITANNNPNTFGQQPNATFTVTVTSSSPLAPPTGAVFLSEGSGTPLLPLTTNAQLSISGTQGTATITVGGALAAGTHTITAIYVPAISNNLTSSSASTSQTVNTGATPAFSQSYPLPAGACICTPLEQLIYGAGSHNWYVKAAGSSLTVTTFARAINATDPETVRARVFDSAGSQVGADIVASYPAGTSSGTETSGTGTVSVTAGQVYRVSVSTPNTPPFQTVYRLKFQGASEAAMPSNLNAQAGNISKTSQWLLNAAAGEQLSMLFVPPAFIPPPGNGAAVPWNGAMNAVVQVFDTADLTTPVLLIDPNDPSGQTTTTTATLTGAFGPNGPSGINATIKIAAAPATPKIYAFYVESVDGDYRLIKNSGSDSAIYLSSSAAGHGTLTINTVVGSLPVTSLQVTVLSTPPGSGNGTDAPTTIPIPTFNATDAQGGGPDVGHYRIQFTAPAGYIVTPSIVDFDETCDGNTTINLRVTAAQALVTVSAPSDGIYGQTGLFATAAGGSGTGAYSFSAGGSTACTVNASTGAITVTSGSGTCTITATRAGDADYLVSAPSAAVSVAVHQASTTTSLAADHNPSALGQSVTFTATINPVAPGGGTLSGTVTFREGTTELATVNVSGGQAAFSTSALAVGYHSITATYSGDSNVTGSAASGVSELVFAYAAGGSFVIGDLSATVGAQVEFWGAQWDKQNAFSGGSAPASFKGFANTTSTNPPARGGGWTGDPGNSSQPPAGVAAYIGVIVSSTVTQSGSTISGNVVRLVVVRTNAGYDANPGHEGTGTVVAVVQP